MGRKCVSGRPILCVGEARDEREKKILIKGDDSGCGRPPAVVAPPSPPSDLLALDPPISVGCGAPSCRDERAKITAYSLKSLAQPLRAPAIGVELREEAPNLSSRSICRFPNNFEKGNYLFGKYDVRDKILFCTFSREIYEET